MNQKGFTLFTALISFILISLALLLVQNMVSAENTTINIINDIQEQDEMRALADLARADAAQIFNLNLRRQIESYLELNEISLDWSNDWPGLKKSFAETYFGGRCVYSDTSEPCEPTENNTRCICGEQLANFVAKNIEIILKEERRYKDFQISFAKRDETARNFKDLLAKIIKETVRSKSKEFFSVVSEECSPKNPEKCSGFYMNLDLKNLSETEYEMLPKIRVRSSATARVVEEPVFPYGNFRIFIPSRLFKAMAISHALAYSPNATSINDDFGLLSMNMHNRLEEYKLGVCDAGRCGYRINPYQETQDTEVLGEFCVGSISFLSPDSRAKSKIQGIKLSFKGKTVADKYEPWVEQNQKLTLEAVTREALCDFIARETSVLNPGTDFELVSGGDCAYAQITVSAISKQSKKIFSTTGEEFAEGTGSPETFDVREELSSSQSCGSVGLGVYSEEPSRPQILKRLSGSEVIDFSQYLENSSGPSDSVYDGESFCSELDKIEITLAFEEKSKLYMVDKQRETPLRYKIKIRDNFSTFNPMYSGDQCLMTSAPQAKQFNATDWVCVQKKSSATIGELALAGRCSPM